MTEVVDQYDNQGLLDHFQYGEQLSLPAPTDSG